MTKNYYVGIACPWGLSSAKGKQVCGWDVAENIDYLSPDLMAKFKNIDVPLLRIDAKNENDAVKQYKQEFPQTKKWRLLRLCRPG